MATARGKYKNVIDKLPRYLGDNPGWQSKVDAVKGVMTADPEFPITSVDLAREYTLLREEKSQLDKQVSDLNLRLEAVTQLMGEQFEKDDMPGIRIGGYAISTYMEPYAQVVDPEAYRAWVLADDDLRRQMTLSWQTTNSLMKARLLEGESEPPGVTAFAKLRIRLEAEK